MTCRTMILSLMTAAAVALPVAAPAKDKGHGNDNAGHAAAGCPPGLAKKSPACVPPGLAKKAPAYDGGHVHRDDRVVIHDGHTHLDSDGRVVIYNDRYDSVYHYRIGDRVDGDYVVVRDPQLYGLDPDGLYYRVDNGVYQVDRETQEILAIIGLASRILN